MVASGLESCAAAPYDRERTKSPFSQFAELVSLFHCCGEAGEDLQQDTLEIKGKDAHPGRQETRCNCPKRKSCGCSETKDNPQKCRRRFTRHDLKTITMLVYSLKPIAFLREKVKTRRENTTQRLVPLKSGVRWVDGCSKSGSKSYPFLPKDRVCHDYAHVNV